MKKIALLVLTIFLFNCNGNAQDSKKEKKDYEITKTEAEWKQILSNEAYQVLRKAGTERPFSSALNKEYGAGVYVCAACETPLFNSEDKFDSGTGWPSFDREIKGNVEYSVDYNLGHARTEEHCATCGGHLGHVFNDGPSKTTGKRHCINGVALKFIPKK
ncbi:peptide-methionine (R)-S-oxide reductase [Lacinutrix venerupis]|uniref:peptide-methionine (R)-S-oxide reductase n=1 Tax=Lacinutrix venerupis TaxID=1486034 RepID=A0AAC9LMK6_9FLAO|nr:peptide-methionine (R)-S-oxide reductase MsrB [Lacinutrix venerupis]APY00102.1 peptide-methionine (R)-S-oxide reductase [Lacinutrix venerupis]RLJ69080.1 peptide-methionine (R)-S-oxide reductase [Lacinutrix venerupis]